MIHKFNKWLENNHPGVISESSNPGSKTGLYPLGYGGIGLYPPAWYLTRSADAIFYLSIDERIYKGKDDIVINKLPGRSEKSLNAGEGPIWDITHLGGKPSHPTQKNYAAKNGEKVPWDISHLDGKPTYKKNKDFVPDGGDGGVWNINHIPS
jgi:hypothetical protein